MMNTAVYRKLPQDGIPPTMVKRILQQQQLLCATLLQIRKTDLMPNDGEINAIEAFVEVMTPLVEITETIGGEKWVI